MSNNQLNNINGVIYNNWKHLELLNVSSNQLTFFDYAMIPQNLKHLDLHDNLIEEIGNYYGLENGDLQTLDISFNRVKQLSKESFLQNLRIINLDQNHISNVRPHTFDHLKNLSTVYLRGNHLTILPLPSLKVDTAAVETGIHF